jgi:hypothetical protein
VQNSAPRGKHGVFQDGQRPSSALLHRVCRGSGPPGGYPRASQVPLGKPWLGNGSQRELAIHLFLSGKGS